MINSAFKQHKKMRSMLPAIYRQLHGSRFCISIIKLAH